MKKYLLMFILALSAHDNIFSQNYSTVHPSPNIGWSLASVKQENNLFTGTTGIHIPIYEIPAGKTTLPITLSYYSKAMQVDQLPSWVGLGWNLNIGGQVTRVVHGKPDESRETKSYTIRTTTIMGGMANSTEVSTQILTDNDFAYIQNYNKLNSANWNTYSYLWNTLNALPADETSPNITIIINYDNGGGPPTILPQPTYDITRNYDFEPDEYHFNVGNISGKFYLNHEGNWICESGSGNYKVEPLMANSISKSGVLIPRLIYGFIITGPDGVKYYFGGSAANKLQNLEYWRGPAGSGIIGENMFQIFGNAYLSVCPNAWYLNKIESPDNSFINFEYKKGEMQLMYSDAPWGHGNNTGLSRDMPGFLHQSLAEPWYLTKVTSSNGYVVELESVDSHQLGTDLKLFPELTLHSTFTNYADILFDYLDDYNNLQKLVSIKVKDGAELIKTFQFDYIDELSQRLKLTALKEVFGPTGELNNKYTFTYNVSAGLLPAYGSGKTDHFGFYNNKRFFTNNTQVAYAISRTDFETQYFESREPDFNYAKMETLDKVYFPTGGYRQYIYEPNYYSSSIQRWPFSTVNHSIDKVTGGIRIAKIIDYTDNGQLATETEFVYKSSLTATLSSGILGVPVPQYISDNSSGGYDFRTRSFVPYDRLQSHIVYQTVYEKLKDGSYIKYDYSSYADAAANDAVPFYETPAPAFFDQIPYINNSFKRGLLKKGISYSAAGESVKEEEYKYQDQFDSYTRYIRAVRIKRGDQATGTGFRVAAYPLYYFPNVIRNKKETLKSTAGDIVTESDFTYDTYNNVVQATTKNSKGHTIEVSYKYPYDFSSPGSQSNIYTKMVNKRMLSPVVEQRKVLIKNNNRYLVDAAVNDFNEFENAVILTKNKYLLRTGQLLPESSVSATQYNTSLNNLTVDPKLQRISSYQFNEKANILNESSTSEPPRGFLWDYNNQQYLVAKVDNAINEQAPVVLPQTVHLIIPAASTALITHPFQQFFAGDINFSLSFNNAPNVNSIVKVTCSLSPTGNSQNLCISTTLPCSGTPTSGVFSNVPPGNYIFNVSINENTSSPAMRVAFTYSDRQMGGLVEFFYQGFEQSTTALTTTPYAGKKYYSGDYTVPYAIPNARSYKVNYHYLDAGVWKNMTKDYTNNMVLTEGEAIDEVRVYPVDAFMTTYTYNPLMGMTSETDPNGKTTFFEYDKFQRLRLLRDQDGNIIKTYEYKYKQ